MARGGHGTLLHMANEQQVEHWAGEGGEHWAREQERYDRMLAPFRDRLVEALAPSPGEVILDVGCGSGALALAIAPLVAPGGHVTGIDISTPMLGRARERATELAVTNVDFIEADAQTHALEPARAAASGERGTFDAFTSRFGIMFFDDPPAAFANLAGALRSGGRAAFMCWQDMLVNEWITVPVFAALQHVPMPELGGGGPGPFSLADADATRALVEAAGLAEVEVIGVDLPHYMGESVEDTVAFLRRTDMARRLMAGAEPGAAERAWDAIATALEPHATSDGVVLGGLAWLVTGRKP